MQSTQKAQVRVCLHRTAIANVIYTKQTCSTHNTHTHTHTHTHIHTHTYTHTLTHTHTHTHTELRRNKRSYHNNVEALFKENKRNQQSSFDIYMDDTWQSGQLSSPDPSHLCWRLEFESWLQHRFGGFFICHFLEFTIREISPGIEMSFPHASSVVGLIQQKYPKTKIHSIKMNS